MRPGTYEWTWGNGPDQNFTVDIRTLGAAVPESSTWVMMLLGFAGLGFAGYRHGEGRSPQLGWGCLSALARWDLWDISGQGLGSFDHRVIVAAVSKSGVD